MTPRAERDRGTGPSGRAIAVFVISVAASAAAFAVPEARPGADPPSKGNIAPTLRQAVVAAGGGRSTGGSFAIDGTIGQADPDPLHPTTGGMFAVGGGFWPGTLRAAPPGDAVFGNGFESGGP